MSDDFSIGTLATRAGVTPGVLRTWENRFGFPVGRRTSTGHRRYTDSDVELVQDVLRTRAGGVPLHLAIDSALRHRRSRAETSVHAALVREFPDLERRRASKPALLAASHALEDECLARADRPIALGAFQEGHRYSRSRHRWEELARTASWCAVVADFRDEPAPEAPSRPVLCQLPDDSPLRREWTVVTLSAGFAGVVSAWEVPVAPGRPREFEAVISTRRDVSLAAGRVIAEVARNAGAEPPEEAERMLAEATPPLSASTSNADRVWARALAHLEARAVSVSGR